MWKEILIGFFIAGLLMVLVPDNWWRNLFVTQGTVPVRLIENAVESRAANCSRFFRVFYRQLIPLASLLWSSGISFGGVISFIYADILIIYSADSYLSKILRARKPRFTSPAFYFFKWCARETTWS